MFFSMVKMYVNLVQSKRTKMRKQEISSIGRNVLEFFRVSFLQFLFDLQEGFQVAFTYETNVECQIRSYCCNLFFMICR